MPVIVRDAVASDHLVYAWPFPIGPEEHEVSCNEDELVVMCPAWLVGDRLGPGRHRWRTPDPSRPVSAYFVLTAPVEVSFDCITQFMIPTTGQHVRIRAQGSLQVRCMDPALLIAQFVGLPFDAVNDGVLRSVSRSIERMLARLLTRRVVMAGTPVAVTDPQMLSNIIEELVAYNPTAGAVFGVELMRFGHLAIVADDGTRPWQQMIMSNGETSVITQRHQTHPLSQADIQVVPEPPAPPPPKSRAQSGTLPPPVPQAIKKRDSQPNIASGEIGSKPARAPTPQPTEVSGEIGGAKPRPTPASPAVVSGEIGGGVAKPRPTPPSQGAVAGEIGGVARPSPTPPSQPAVSGEVSRPWAAPTSPSGWAAPTTPDATPPTAVSGELGTKPAPPSKKTSLGVAVSDPAIPLPKLPTPTPTGSQPGSSRPTIPSIPPIPAIPATPKPGARKPEIQVAEEPTHPGIDIRTPLPGAPGAALSAPSGKVEAQGTPPPQVDSGHDSRGSILGIGVAHIGSAGTASGEITKKIAPGGRVLVPGPNGLMQSATVRQLLQGYYELEVGGSGETIWVPVNGVVPE